jgi:hypothetical protein
MNHPLKSPSKPALNALRTPKRIIHVAPAYQRKKTPYGCYFGTLSPDGDLGQKCGAESVDIQATPYAKLTFCLKTCQKSYLAFILSKTALTNREIQPLQ